MTQSIRRRRFDEHAEAKRITNYPDPESVPEGLKNRLATELTVRATCPQCAAEAYYYSEDAHNTVNCKGEDCDEQFILP